MNSKNWIWMALLGAAIVSDLGVAAETNTFTNAKGDGDWANPANWDPAQIPDHTKLVRMSRGAEMKITTPVVIDALQMGATGPCSILIDGGSLNVGQRGWNSIAYHSNPCRLTIQNGGSAIFSGHLAVGRKDSKGASVILHQGTLRVQGIYSQNREVAGAAVINTRTTINTGGVLDVDTLDLGAGVLDIAGGTVIVRISSTDNIMEWMNNGRIIAMGGLDGWSVKVAVSEETGWITLTAEQEEIVLGKKPVTTPSSGSHRAG